MIERIQHADVLAQVGHVADRRGITVYAVGGIVRDSLLDRRTQEIDFVCIGQDNGIRLAKELQTFPGTGKAHIYENFGTAGIEIPAESQRVRLEFVGARKESYRRDSRKPIVEEGTLAEDLKRRDFTVNAMALSVNEATFGRLDDPFGGREDLELGILRTPLDPAQTFDDDPLRMVRAARFAAQLDFRLADGLMPVMAEHAHRLSIVSQERITEELRKLICAASPGTGFRILHESGLLDGVLPELSDLAGVETVAGYRHKDNLYHTLQVVDNVAVGREIEVDDPEEWLRWAALLHDVGKTDAKRFAKGTGWTFHGHEEIGARLIKSIFRSLKMPGDERRDYVEKLVRLHHRPVALVDESVTDSAIRRLLFDAGDDIDDLMRLVRADITSKNPRRVQKYLRNFDIVEQKLIDVEARDRLRNFQPPLDGNEIMEAVGVEEGVAVGIIKENIRESILEGDIPNEHDAAYEMMLDIKDDAIRRARVFEHFIQSLDRDEKRVIGRIKERVFFGDLPEDPEALRQELEKEKRRLLEIENQTGAAS